MAKYVIPSYQRSFRSEKEVKHGGINATVLGGAVRPLLALERRRLVFDVAVIVVCIKPMNLGNLGTFSDKIDCYHSYNAVL